MNRKIVVKENRNSEKNFLLIRQDILRIAKDRDTSVLEIIEEFMEDIKHHGEEDYQKNIQEININENVTDKVLNKLKVYLNKLKKTYKEKENKEKRQTKLNERETNWKQIEEIIDRACLEGKQGTKKEIIESLIEGINNNSIEYEFKTKEKKIVLKKLKEMINEIDKKEAMLEQEKEIKEENSKKAMEQIQTIVNREYELGNIENKSKYLSTIKDAITGKNEEINLDIKMEKISEEYLLNMLDDTIKMEKEELYFEQVRRFTDDFKFLRAYPEIENARHGYTKREKFTDSESYKRFCSLREKLQKEYNEYNGINNILKDSKQKITDTDKRILLERKEVIEKELEKVR